MNDKDKEAFEKWYQHRPIFRAVIKPEEAWQAACEYKDKQYSYFIIEAKCHAQTKVNLEILQAENKKLREAIEYALEWSGDTNAWNRLNEMLKEVG